LTLYASAEWEKIAHKLSALPLTNASARAFVRHMLAGAMAVDIDSVGRVVIPQYLRKFANLSGTVIIAGLYNRIEIWNESDWQAYQDNALKETENVAEKLTDLGV
ncbi:cell division/cell wall cluster transcriptional repressor MraZ, partial [Patescibacteria group bacterium]|nr:cell division/cell wall cluster transcriptional repressor MraZ [Patescibacteria group bacterium]